MTNKEHSNIILIDGEYLEFITTDFKKSFEGIIGRNLNDIDLADLIVEFAHMGGISGSNNNIEVIFIYNDKATYFNKYVALFIFIILFLASGGGDFPSELLNHIVVKSHVLRVH